MARTPQDKTPFVLAGGGRSTRRWLESGGLEQRRIPGALRPHVDEPSADVSCDAPAQAR